MDIRLPDRTGIDACREIRPVHSTEKRKRPQPIGCGRLRCHAEQWVVLTSILLIVVSCFRHA